METTQNNPLHQLGTTRVQRRNAELKEKEEKEKIAEEYVNKLIAAGLLDHKAKVSDYNKLSYFEVGQVLGIKSVGEIFYVTTQIRSVLEKKQKMTMKETQKLLATPLFAVMAGQIFEPTPKSLQEEFDATEVEF